MKSCNAIHSLISKLKECRITKSKAMDLALSANALSANALTARSGNKAETDLCTDPSVLTALTRYFGKPIKDIRKVNGRKKADNVVECEDGTVYRLQNKNGTGGGRGWSVDRRSIDKMDVADEARTLVGAVCLKQGARSSDNIKIVPDVISTLLLGIEAEYMPTHFTHTKFDSETGRLIELSIAPSNIVIDALKKEVYEHFVPKRTCVHLSPHLYFQRKGGGSKDHAPDDIQVKLRCFPDGIFETIHR